MFRNCKQFLQDIEVQSFMYPLVVFAMLLLPSFANAAVENNSMRLGDDYKIFNLQVGDTYQACERACEKDRKCQAWTFIRERVKTREGLSFNLGKGFSINLGGDAREVIPAQCRLKHSAGAAYKNDCCVSGIIRTVQEQSTRREDKCSRLANRSVKQHDRNLKEKCGYRGRQWSDRYVRHFDQCMDVGPDRFKNRVLDRKSLLKQCSVNRKELNVTCDNFARLAVKSADTNTDLKCGFDGKGWSDDYDGHYFRCQNMSAEKRGLFQKEQKTKVAACVGRGGGPYNATCDTYATKAVEQYGTNRDLRCGLSGQRWHANFKQHYQSCMSMSSWRRRSESRARDSALSSCKAQNNTQNDYSKCRTFVQEALKLNRQNEDNSCGYTRRTRWHNNHDKHLGFCHALERNERTSEIETRQQAIRRCVGNDVREEGYNAKRRCRGYANDTIALIRKNQVLGCGLEGRLWSGKFRDHQEWCLNASKRRQMRRQERRETKIRACQTRIEEEKQRRERRTKACKPFSVEAVRDAEKGHMLGCDFEGKLWSREKNVQFEQCLQLNRIERQQAESRRSESLRHCDRRRDERDVRHCGNFVRRAMKQVRRNKLSGCHLSGKGFWHGDAKLYMKQCLAEEKSSERISIHQRRKIALVQCRNGERTEFNQALKRSCLERNVTGIGYGFFKRGATEKALAAWKRGSERVANSKIDFDAERLSNSVECVRRYRRERQRASFADRPNTFEEGRQFGRWMCHIVAKPCRKGRRVENNLPAERVGTMTKWLDKNYGGVDGWRNRYHPRLTGDINGDGSSDIVGMGDATVRVSLSNGQDRFSRARKDIRAFGRQSGGWSVTEHPRMLGDVNGDGRADIVGFGNRSVFLATARSDGSYNEPESVLKDFTIRNGTWTVKDHIRTLADVNGDGRADIVGFANTGVYVAIARRRGRFEEKEKWISAFGRRAGGWEVSKNPRLMGDMDGDGRADIVGIGNSSVYVSLSSRRRFSQPVVWQSDLSRMRRSGHRFVKLADVNGDGMADLLSIARNGLYVSLNRRGSFDSPRQLVEADTASYSHMEVGDVNGDKRPDLIAFHRSGVSVGLSPRIRRRR